FAASSFLNFVVSSLDLENFLLQKRGRFREQATQELPANEIITSDPRATRQLTSDPRAIRPGLRDFPVPREKKSWRPENAAPHEITAPSSPNALTHQQQPTSNNRPATNNNQRNRLGVTTGRERHTRRQHASSTPNSERPSVHPSTRPPIRGQPRPIRPHTPKQFTNRPRSGLCGFRPRTLARLRRASR